MSGLKARIKGLEQRTRIVKPGAEAPALPPAPQTAQELQAVVRQLTGFLIPDKAVCKGHCAPLDAFADAYFAKSAVSVWWGSRGLAGKSTMLALLCFAETVFLRAQVTVLGGSEEQSKRVQEAQDEAWQYEKSPRNLLLREPSPTRVVLVGGAWTRALTASTKSARGPHPQRLRLDEADEMELRILDASLGQPMEKRGVKDQTVISSTYHYADGTFAESIKRAGEKGWPVFQWCYREAMAEPNGWLSQDQVDRKRATVPAVMWETEYELQEPNPESRAILPEAVDWTFDPELGRFAGRPGERIVVEPPVKGARYATGGDWAKERDFTDIPTIRTDTTPWRLVAYERTHRLPWPQMVAKFNDRVREYKGVAAHDGTGIGNVVNDLLTVVAESKVLVGRERSDIFSEWVAALERKEYKSPRIESVYREHKFCSRDDLFGSGHPPDSFVGLALARYAGRPGRKLHSIYG